MSQKPAEDMMYLAEQRRYRRLEVSLPVWLAAAEDFDRAGTAPWTLGYTRDVSMGGAKVYVATSEEEHWRAHKDRGTACLVRFDGVESEGNEYITGRVRHVARDQDSGNIWLGVEYDEGAEEAKSASVRAGLRTVKSRRKWQLAFVAALLVLGLSGFTITKLRGETLRQREQINKLRTQRKQLDYNLKLLSQPRLVGSRAEGIEASFKRKDVQARIRQLTARMSRLSSGGNRQAGEQERASQRALEGLDISAAPAGAVQVNLGIALPYGYAWPLVTRDLEELLGRRIPTIVIFRDWKSPFPLTDCREARVRAKTLQITWEPWLNFIKPIKLKDIVAGKYDRYIDSWARGARTFGNEVYIRWGHEFNGNWYPWSLAANEKSPALYRKAFRHVRDRFSRQGAFNVRWIWCLNAESVPNIPAWNDPLLAYPGDNYVDVISIDGYNFGTSLQHSRWLSFSEIFAIPYSKVVKKFPQKPVMINEVGCSTTGGNKEAWIRDMDRALRTRFSRVQGVVWFEAQKEADWRMVSSPATLLASRQVWSQDYYRRGEN